MMTIHESVDFFFTGPDTPPRLGPRSVLYMVRDDARSCLLSRTIVPEDRVPDEADQYQRVFPTALTLFAGLDLLAKFVAGDGDDHRRTGVRGWLQRLLCAGRRERAGVRTRLIAFLRSYMGLSKRQAETVWQVRNALVHSFGLYATPRGRVIRLTTHCPAPDPDHGPVWQQGAVATICMPHLYAGFLKAVHGYERALRREVRQFEQGQRPAKGPLHANFEPMFRTYGQIQVG